MGAGGRGAGEERPLMSGMAVPAPRRLLIVTVHDVAPPFSAGVRRLLDELDRRAIRPRVLKVVPCYAGRWPLAAGRRR